MLSGELWILVFFFLTENELGEKIELLTIQVSFHIRELKELRAQAATQPQPLLHSLQKYEFYCHFVQEGDDYYNSRRGSSRNRFEDELEAEAHGQRRPMSSKKVSFTFVHVCFRIKLHLIKKLNVILYLFFFHFSWTFLWIALLILHQPGMNRSGPQKHSASRPAKHRLEDEYEEESEYESEGEEDGGARGRREDDFLDDEEEYQDSEEEEAEEEAAGASEEEEEEYEEVISLNIIFFFIIN